MSLSASLFIILSGCSNQYMEQLLKDRGGLVKTDEGEPSFWGDDFDFDDVLENFEANGKLDLVYLKITGHWPNGHTKSLTLADLIDLGYEVDAQCICDGETGEYFITIIIDEETYTFRTIDDGGKIEIIETDFGKIVSEIEIVSSPSRTNYDWNEALDLTGLVVRAAYRDDSDSIVTITSANIRDYNAKKSGDQTVTIYYKGKTATFTVTVNKAKLTGIKIVSGPTKTDYDWGEDLDLTGLAVKALYEDDSELPVDISELGISGYNPKPVIAGGQIVTVTYEEKTATFTVTVNGAKLTGIEIVSGPAKTDYDWGEDLDLTGLVVNALYEDDSELSLDVSGVNISGYNPKKAGSQIVTVTYEEKTATFTVTVGPAPLWGIKIVHSPAKTEYFYGDELDLDGLEVRALYEDDSELLLEITSANISGFDPIVYGKQTVTVTYEGKTATFTVTVNPIGTLILNHNKGPGQYAKKDFSLALYSSDTDAIIYYTTDGSTPDSSSTEYTGPFSLELGTTTVKAIAVKDGWVASEVFEAEYTLVIAYSISQSNNLLINYSVVLTFDEPVSGLKKSDLTYSGNTLENILFSVVFLTASNNDTVWTLNTFTSSQSGNVIKVTFPNVDPDGHTVP